MSECDTVGSVRDLYVMAGRTLLSDTLPGMQHVVEEMR